MALAVFKLNQQALLQADMEGIFQIIREYTSSVEPELLIRTAMGFTFSKTLIDKLEEEYVEKPDKEIIKICKME